MTGYTAAWSLVAGSLLLAAIGAPLAALFVAGCAAVVALLAESPEASDSRRRNQARRVR
jgi:uncharacterized membrane protein YphA (DoxX/SURF4 family)